MSKVLVKTPLGYISAEPNYNPACPGILLGINDGGELISQVAALECTSKSPLNNLYYMNLKVWEEPESDDHTQEIMICRGAGSDVDWKRYIEYLRRWADDNEGAPGEDQAPLAYAEWSKMPKPHWVG